MIDPAINYATFLGGAGIEFSEALALIRARPGAPKIYMTGITYRHNDFSRGRLTHWQSHRDAKHIYIQN